ncbi:MAG: hypothetical protein NXI31_23585 [bacterium]|nr:hypothetical protein [bacterium]
MRWLLAGLMFAAFVAIAIFTATLRAENATRRHGLERHTTEVRDRWIELQRLEAVLLDSESWQRLAVAHSRALAAEFERRRGRLQ